MERKRSQISERPRRRDRECSRIQYLRPRAATRIGVSHYIRTLTAAYTGSGLIGRDRHIERQPRLHCGHTGNLPSAQYFLIPVASVQPKWKRIDVAGHEDVVPVVTGRPIVSSQIVAILRRVVITVRI